ncbi:MULTISPECIES: efflux RND transporter periplasmic adaptor subunit [Pseudanabaena]|jgi:HlyD family secretion protein|uniref:efflux RND transporter periplasmic adaptor subunit n=1 Tax=Pseudanabaena TaxID=1152 RepID=UPI002478D81E|nr:MULTISPECIES: efflux RND transporter periplasmic adaptor subunit [Pseudanabaena]MEA5485494.1 efflux RND transporter periplasmic adaptor subunit [Pseudanabaena sp. CCNP1317]WGS73711.1 efflux RND transporter periplasmic adaptor subunit [Pseudanabaena galeata CCNP1313]
MKAIWMLAAITGLSVGITSCGAAKDATQAQTQSQKPSTAVDVAIAKFDTLQAGTEYTGTTAPIREVSVKSRLEGRLLDLNVDVGDRVAAGQAIAQLDDAVLSATVLQAEAEVAAREAEVSQASAGVGNARAQVERARLEYQQAQADANRFTQLAKDGAVSSQTAETAITRARTAEQSLRSAEQQVSLQQQTVGASSQRVLAQEAIRLREQERQSYTTITAPISGVVLERVSETGNLLFAGNDVIKLGDFSQVKVIVLISELEISKVRLNQSVDVRFDTFPNQKFTGTVRRISPVADPVARLIPVEVVVPNRDNKLGSGQLARVQFSSSQARQIVIAETALEAAGRPTQAPKDANTQPNQQARPKTDTKSNANGAEKGKPKTGSVFVITGDPKEPKVAARKVTLGDRRDGKVVILSGLQEGDRIVVRSGGKLQDGDAVKLSVLSESSK